MLVSTYFGQLNKLTFKKNNCLISRDDDYCQSMYNLYSQHGFNVQYINHIDHDMIVLLIQKNTPNYMTATPIWNQIIEDGKIRLNKHIDMTSRQSPKGIMLAVNTDSFTIKDMNEKLIEQATETTKHKNEQNMIGKLKLEDTMKIKGQRLSHFMIQDEHFDKIEIQEVNPNNTKITGEGAGCGKTFKTTQELLNWNAKHNVFADRIAVNDCVLMGWDELYDFV